MAFRYDPADATVCWPEGDYDAVLLKTIEGESKTGNPMLTLIFEVYNNATGKSQQIKEYIVKATTFKLLRFARALGLEQEFKDKRFNAEDHLNANITVTLGIDIQAGFDDKNVIDGYKTPERKMSPAGASAAAGKPTGSMPTKGDYDIGDKDIPF